MPDSPRSPTKSLIIAILTAIAPLPAVAQDDAVRDPDWTISCSHDGRLLHREYLPPLGADARQRELIRRYPDATCVLVAPAAPTPTITDILRMPIGTEHDSMSIDAALRAITGGEVSTAPAHAPDTGTGDEQDRPDVSSPPRYLPNDPEWVRLATYRTTAREDVLADWHRIASDSPWLGALIPSTVASEDGWIVLSVGPVRAHERPEFCLAVQARGFPCETAPIGAPPPPANVISPFEPEPRPAACPAPTPMMPYGIPKADRLSGRTCWRSMLARAHANPPRIVESPRLSIPMPRPRPANL